MMTATLTGKATANLAGLFTADDELGAQVETFDFDLAEVFASGTAAGEIDAVYQNVHTIAPGDVFDNIDQINVRAAAYTLWGETFTREFAKVRAIYVENLGTLPEQRLGVGPWVDAINWFDAPWPNSYASNTILGPGDAYLLTNPDNGYTVGATRYNIYLWGVPPGNGATGYQGQAFDVRVVLLGVAA